jgi:SAM-dependent methyltransferase
MSSYYQQWMSPGTASIACSLFGHLGLLSSPEANMLNVLETHCGDARAAAGLLPSGAVKSYTATDFSGGMLEAARTNLGDRAKIVHTDSTKLPFEDAMFDRYLSNLGLCCTSDVNAKLSEARRVLAPGGIAAMSMRIEGGVGDTAFRLIQEALAPFGLPPGPDREGVRLGKDLSTLRAKVVAAGFEGGAVAWHTWATLPIHDVSTFMVFATTQPPIRKFLESLDEAKREAAEDALRAAAAAALESGAIQVALAVVIARCAPNTAM